MSLLLIIVVLPLIVTLAAKSGELIKFHAKQALYLGAAFIVVRLIIELLYLIPSEGVQDILVRGILQQGVEVIFAAAALYAGVRAFLNRELKRGLINDCMTDVVVYGGPKGAAIRLAAEEAMCNALGGSYVGADCSVPHGEAPAALAFVTESLGSKLIFDAVLEVWADAENRHDKALFDRVAKSLASTRMIYLMANQLPLLDASGPTIGFVNGAPGPQRPTSGSSARDVFDLLSRLRAWTPSGTGPLTVVAFSDPNDLLSYRVVPRYLAGDLRGFRIVNVIVSNGATYFNYVERPDQAHCGYTRNSHVLALVARGYQVGKPLPEIPGLASDCPDFITLNKNQQ